MKPTDIKMSNFFVRLYRYFYDMDCYDKMPPSLCAFTPKLIVACLLIMPFEIIGLPNTLWNLVFKDGKMPPIGKVGITILFAILFACLYFMGLPIINHWIPQKHDDIIASCVLDVCVFCIIIWALYRRKYSGFIGDYLKTKRDKICPKINWIDDEV